MIYVVRCEARGQHTRVAADFETFTYTDKAGKSFSVDGFTHAKRMMTMFAQFNADIYYPGSHLCHVQEGMDLKELNNRPAIYIRRDNKTEERWYITIEEKADEEGQTTDGSRSSRRSSK